MYDSIFRVEQQKRRTGKKIKNRTMNNRAEYILKRIGTIFGTAVCIAALSVLPVLADQVEAESDHKTAKEELLQGEPVAVDVDLPDGEYSIELNMIGGSGRASISSPTWMTVKDGKAYAKLLWSSAHYDYMILGDKTFLNETTDGGNSTFTIPIVQMDESFPVIADTTAMGDPVEIRYEMTFYSETMGAKGRIPQEAAKKVLIIAAVILVVGFVLNLAVKKIRGRKR